MQPERRADENHAARRSRTTGGEDRIHGFKKRQSQRYAAGSQESSSINAHFFSITGFTKEFWRLPLFVSEQPALHDGMDDVANGIIVGFGIGHDLVDDFTVSELDLATGAECHQLGDEVASDDILIGE